MIRRELGACAPLEVKLSVVNLVSFGIAAKP